MDTFETRDDVETAAEIAGTQQETHAANADQPTTEAKAEMEKAAKEQNPLEIQRKKLGLTLDELANACEVPLPVLKYVLYTSDDDILTKRIIAASMGDALEAKHEKAKADLAAALENSEA